MNENIEVPTAAFREIPGFGGYFYDWSEESAAFLRKHKFKEIHITGGFSDLSFLAEYADFLKSLVVTNEIGFYSGIESLINLNELHVNGKAKKPVSLKSCEC